MPAAQQSQPNRDDEKLDPRCMFCGGPQAHRVGDVIRSRHRAGDSVQGLDQDYRLTPRQILKVLGDS